MKLSGQQIGQIQAALLEAYNKDTLRMLVRIELNAELDEIAGGDNLRVVTFNLVSWAEQTGRELALIQGAYRQNQGNPKLQQLVQDAQGWFPAPAAPPAAPAAPALSGSHQVFLSYSRHDSALMQQVRSDLQAAGIVAWIDEAELEPGTLAWQRAIQRAIRQAQAMLVLLSPQRQRIGLGEQRDHLRFAMQGAHFPRFGARQCRRCGAAGVGKRAACGCAGRLRRGSAGQADPRAAQVFGRGGSGGAGCRGNCGKGRASGRRATRAGHRAADH